MGLDIALSKFQTAQWKELLEALAILEEKYNSTKKYNYDKRYEVLLRSEKEWSKYEDVVSGKTLDLSITHEFDADADIAVLDAIHESTAHAQLRRTIISHEKIMAIKNSSKWKSLYKDAKALQAEMDAFWLKTDEIKKQRSTEIRNAEVLLRTKGIVDFRNKVETYFKEGRHRDYGEALSYEMGLTESLLDIDSTIKILMSRKFGTFKDRE